MLVGREAEARGRRRPRRRWPPPPRSSRRDGAAVVTSAPVARDEPARPRRPGRRGRLPRRWRRAGRAGCAAPAAGGPGRGPCDELGARRGGCANAAQLRDGRGPEDAVDGQARVALEVGQRRRGQVAEDAVHPAGVEAQRGQASLQVGDVVAAEHGPTQVEEPVPEAQPGLDQGRPGLAPAHAVDAQAPAVLEALDRGLGPGPEDSASDVRERVEADRDPSVEPGAVWQVSDGLAARPPGASGQRRRRALQVRRRAPGGAAPCPWRR